MTQPLERMKELIARISEANKAYYHLDQEIMSNFEYDALYDELVELEKETGHILSNSPTQKVGYEVLSELPKERHLSPMLSLDKTKDRVALKSWLGNQEGLLSYKLDGLTIVLTYEKGQLTKAVTRGNGEIGEVITNNAKVFENIPLQISFQDTLVLRGEAVISYPEFERINSELSFEEQYKNPRNLCSGSVRQLNNEITARRHVRFYAFALVNAMVEQSLKTRHEEMTWLKTLGFDVVENKLVTADTLDEVLEQFAADIPNQIIGSDGLVLTFNEIAYAQSLGNTSKFPRHSIAFKWQDEIRETKLVEVEWNASRTGLINPIAIFESVELEGTSVKRASLHNISIIEALELGLGDTITVYKANMIIPQVEENLTRSNTLEIPKACPVCGGETVIQQERDVKALYCSNPDCPAKRIKAFGHFVSRDAMNIEGLSEATLEKLIEEGYLNTFPDLFNLQPYQDAIENMEGLGKKSFQKLQKALKKSKTVQLPNFIYALGIQNVGLSNAKLLAKHFKYDLQAILQATPETFLTIDGYGEVISQALATYFAKEQHKEMISQLVEILDIQIPEISESGNVLDGMTFVITGSLELYENRKALQDAIETMGGKVSGSVSAKTTYLINNDVTSTSGKNKKANELGIEILSEKAFVERWIEKA